MKNQFSAVAVALLGGRQIEAFYLPGVNPISFGVGDTVKLKVNKMTSTESLLPIEYYRLPFCQPDGGPKMDNENLGEFLAGDRIESSPYKLNMKEDMYCEQVCITNLGRGEAKGTSPNKVVRAIRRGYHNNWIVDNIPSASKQENSEKEMTKYFSGFPLGFVADDTKLAYINNHVNIEIEYHPVDTETEKFRVVRFTVEPFSIKHDFEVDFMDDDDKEDGSSAMVAKISNPIPSCGQNKKNIHTTFYMINQPGRVAQLASGKVLFTYDVIWKENPNLHWASRWDIYLSMNEGIPTKVHWLSIAQSLVIVFVLSAIVIRNLCRAISRCSKVAKDEEGAENMTDLKWTLVHADVFRAPNNPMLLSVFCGTGIQLLCMSALTIILSAMGFLNPSNRGSLLMAILLLYALMGTVGGYVTARMYKTFKGQSWQKATTLVAFGFPSVAFAIFFLMVVMAMSYGSSYAVPFTTLLVLLGLWFGILTPLVFIGAYFGYKVDAIEFPVDTSDSPRQIPVQPWLMGELFRLLVGGLFPFGCCFLELYFIMSSVWMNQYYYTFGFLFLVFILLLVTCAEITVLFTYYQLCREDYKWWWRSYLISGSAAFYVFGYSFIYFKQLNANTPAAYVLYFGYMILLSFGLFLITGSVGVLSSLWFNKTIFGSLYLSDPMHYQPLVTSCSDDGDSQTQITTIVTIH